MDSNIWYYIILFNLAGVITMFLYHQSVKRKLDKLHMAYETLAEIMQFDVLVLYTMSHNVLKVLDLTPEQLAKHDLPPIDLEPQEIQE
jgi:hypothetical protein